VAEEPAGITALHEVHLQAVFTYILHRVPNRAEAEDITAEVFVAAMAALPKFRGQSSSYAWLLGIARRKIADSARSRRRRPERLEIDLSEEERAAVGGLLALDSGPLPEEAVQHDEARRVMQKLLAALPEAQREALLLQVVHDLSIREISQVMRRSEGAVKCLLQRARAAIYRSGQSYFAG
jgi:RNA polymerase sigma-70 factor (ECF subfamily)